MNPSIPTTPSHVSVNRVHVVDLPGLPIDDEVRDRRAYELLSSRAVIRYAREQAEALRLPAAYAQDGVQTRLELPRFVDACLNSPDERARAAAQAIGRRLGRNLGHVLLALRRGDAVNRTARPDWTDQDWERWAGIKRVWLGGGMVSGRLGERIVAHARAFLTQAGYAEHPRVALTSHPAVVTLLGAGRYLPATMRHALCLDFGHTRVKRACLGFKDGTLTRLRRYAPLPTGLDWLSAPCNPNPDTGRWVLDFMAAAVAQTLDECRNDGLNPGADLMLCVAAYVREGRLLGNGLYANLSTLSDDAQPLLAEAIRARIGQPVRVHLIHDGSAACAVHAGEPNTAVILVGTALGIGFPPPDAHRLRPLAPTLDNVILT
jgi:hypothetical protein